MCSVAAAEQNAYYRAMSGTTIDKPKTPKNITDEHGPSSKHSFHQQAREEWLGYLGEWRRLLVRKLDGDEVVLILPTMPKVLDFARIHGFIPLEAY